MNVGEFVFERNDGLKEQDTSSLFKMGKKKLKKKRRVKWSVKDTWAAAANEGSS
jgi:hypothetical protein